jgi:hypothetical protein
MIWSTGKKRMAFRMEKLRTDGRKHMKNKQNEYNAPKTIKDWQKLLNAYESIINDYPNISERDKIIIEAEKIREKIKNMQNEQKK